MARTLVVFFPLWPVLWIVWRLGGPHPSPHPKGNALTPGPSPDAGEGTTGPHPSPLPKGEGTTVGIRGWKREVAQLAVMLCLAVYVINVGYGFEGSLKPLGDYRFVSRMFRG